ncbi:MAG: hypothetical protein OXG59_06160 [Gammaproteobacteria bacterium]|nr:hypothetical protein [Gammaproteobacteria bacterium]
MIAIAITPESGAGQTGLTEPVSTFRDCNNCPEMVVGLRVAKDVE